VHNPRPTARGAAEGWRDAEIGEALKPLVRARDLDGRGSGDANRGRFRRQYSKRRMSDYPPARLISNLSLSRLAV